ncbi:E3 ubiquitin-protein ligase DTX4-like [Solea senegalensis]|uniref:E3 ubiquitin-protein ligase n=2 Tax=Solea senegalensis TaxID=28829 RepID=A0AAV6QX36_SOLSE|nr:E3 ubiquitin-protein ligase DTX4-like [Solea senegalensis]
MQRRCAQGCTAERQSRMLLASAVVVWEWLNEHGRWRPYSPAVCHHIEAVIRSDPRCGSVVLGQVDSRLSPYIIDLHSMHQFRQDTGTLRPVRRSFYDPTSAPGQGWLWEWENDAGSWTAYDTDVGIAIQAARDRQQPWLDLAPLGFCYLIDFESMTQINGQTQRCRRIQRRSDLAYPLVSGPLPKSHHAWGPASVPSNAGLLGVDVSGVGMGLRMSNSGTGNGSAYPSGALPASAITSLGQPCACQQCMLVLSVKAGTMSTAHTLGRRPPQTKPPSPKISSHPAPGGSYSLTLPRPPSLSRSLSPNRTSIVGATGGYSVSGMGGAGGVSIVGGSGVSSASFGFGGGFTHSLSLLGSATAALSISSTRPPPPPLPPPPPPPAPLTSSSSVATSPPHPSNSSSAPLSVSCSASAVCPPGPPLISTVASTCTPSPSARVLGPVSSSGAAACAAPLPPRSSLAGLSRPALQRIAMAQSRALIASGVPTVPVKNLNGSSPVHPALAGITGILMSAAGLPVCLTRPPKLVLHPPPVSKSDIKPVPGLGHCCRKTTKKQARKGKTPEEVVKRYLQKVRNPPEEDCTICMEALAGPSGYKGPGVGGISRAESVGRLAQCGHQYHLQCLVAMYNNGNKDGSLQCPTCKTIYGVKTGNQPPGKMEYHVIPHSLPGHPDCKTIRIIYNIPPGIQGPEHPNPGKPFTARGFPRHCYLPDSEKGRKVLRLLLVAWDRRLIFSVGTSSTTGESDTVIWNEVHHKTEFGSNLTGHGYPDPGHLDNVLEELKAQGITEEECLPRD